MDEQSHWCCFALIFVSMLCNVALSMEDNSSRILYVPRSEFIRVIQGILRTTENSTTDDTMDSKSLSDVQMGLASNAFGYSSGATNKISTPRSAAVRIALAQRNEKIYGKGSNNGLRSVKRDSFYFLQRSLERRDSEIKEYMQATSGSARSGLLTRRSIAPRDGTTSSGDDYLGSHAT